MKLILFLAAAAAAFPAELKVAAVQFRSSFQIEDNTARIVTALEKLAAQKVQVAVFPECALTGYHTGPTMEATPAQLHAAEKTVAQACRRNRIAAVVGSVFKSGPRAYNVALVFDEQGELVERYGKLQLAGEKWATPGNHMALFDLAGIPSTIIICHDERYPEFVRLPAIAGARLIYYISHESGMKAEHKLPGYRAQMMARAVENQMFAVSANAPGNPNDNSGSHGQSRIIRDDGNIVQEASIFGDEVLIATLDIKPGRLTRPLEGVTGQWWAQGVELLRRDRNKKLE